MDQELIVDLISQKILLMEINARRKKYTCELITNINKYEHNLLENHTTIEELREDKKILSRVLKKELTGHKSFKSIVIITVLAFSIFGFISYVPNNLSSDQNSIVPLKTQYLIQNLKGDTIDTWKSWNIAADQVLYVNIINADKVSQDSLDAIKNAILSEEIVTIDDSLQHKGPKGATSIYYDGWSGALKQASKNSTKYHIPTEFKIMESGQGKGDITINLVTAQNADGYSGYTKSTTENEQILKAAITIYDVNSLSTAQISTIILHEFGHALGLAHSTAPEDLMAPVITTNYPYISECDLDGIVSLYDGKTSSQMVCEK